MSLLCSPGSPFWCIVIVQVENVCGLLLDWQDESAGGFPRLGTSMYHSLGLILKCRVINEKMKHCNVSNTLRKVKEPFHPPSDLGPDSRKLSDPRHPRSR